MGSFLRATLVPATAVLRPHPASPASAEGDDPTALISCISGTLGFQGDYAAEHALRLKLEMQLAEVLDLCDDSSLGVALSCALLRCVTFPTSHVRRWATGAAEAAGR